MASTSALERALGPSWRLLAPTPAAAFAADLPAGLREFYAAHSGQVAEHEGQGALHGLHVFSVPRAPSTHGFVGHRCISVPHGAVAEAPIPRWFFAGDVFSGDGFLFVDTQPGPRGCVGQVVALDLLGNRLVVLGESMAAFLDLLSRLRHEAPEAARRGNLLTNLDLLLRLKSPPPDEGSLREERGWVERLGAPWTAALRPYCDPLRGAPSGLDHVRRLALDAQAPVTSLAPLERLPDLRALQCATRASVDLGPLAATRRLKHLELRSPRAALLDAAPLATCEELVELRLGALRDLRPLGALSSLAILDLGGEVDLAALAALCPQLRELRLSQADAVLHPEARDRFPHLTRLVEPTAPGAGDDLPTHRWRRSHAHRDPTLDLEEQLQRAALDLLVGLVAEGSLLTASSHGPRALAPRAGSLMARHPDAHQRAAALGKWLLDEDEVVDLLLDDAALAARVALVYPDRS